MERLRFLADESCDFAVVRALRAAEYDVLAAGEMMQRSVDRALMEQAYREQRVLLTEDKDFGWLVFVSQARSAGVILLRYPALGRESMVRTVLQLVTAQAEAIRETFVVIQPGHIRISPRPEETID